MFCMEFVIYHRLCAAQRTTVKIKYTDNIETATLQSLTPTVLTHIQQLKTKIDYLS